MENFLNRLNRNPYQPIDGASVTKFDELGNGLDDWGNVIAPKFEAPQQTWGETALGVATAPARLAAALAGSLSPYGADGWQVPPVAQEGWNALTAVGDAYTQGMSDEEINSRALGMAGFMMGGGGLAARPTVRAAPSQIAAKSEMDIAMENLRRAVDDDLGDKSPYWNRPLEPRDLTLYHGTGSEFDRFNTPDVWASDSADMASNWAMRKDNPSVIPLEVKGARITRPKDQTLDPEAERARALAEGYDAIDWGKFDGGNYYQLVRPGTVKSPTTGETLFSNASKEGAGPAIASALNMSPEASYRGYRGVVRADSPGPKPDGLQAYWMTDNKDMASSYAKSWYDDLADSPAVFPTEARFDNPLVVDANGSDWRNIQHMGDYYTSSDLIRLASANKNDGVVIKNVIDPSNADLLSRDGISGVPPATVFAAINRGTVRSPLTGETLFSNASKEGAAPALLAGQEAAPLRGYHGSMYPDYLDTAKKRGEFWAASDPSYDGIPVNSANPERLYNFFEGSTGQTAYPSMTPVEMQFKNPLVAGGDAPSPWTRVPFEGGQASTEDIVKLARERGNDGVIFKNLQESGPVSDEYVALGQGTVRSPLTGETLFSNASKESGIPAIASALDMSPEARLARAREMGFDTDEPLYHGTMSTFDAFKNGPTFFSPERGVAAGYSRQYGSPTRGTVGEYFVKKGNEADLTGHSALISELADELDVPSRALSEALRTGGLYNYFDEGVEGEFFDALKRRGFDTVRLNDAAPGDGSKTTSVVALSPRNIRSVNAAFDPAKSDSANLLAANADSKPALLAGALGQEQNVPDWLLPFLQGM